MIEQHAERIADRAVRRLHQPARLLDFRLKVAEVGPRASVPLENSVIGPRQQPVGSDRSTCACNFRSSGVSVTGTEGWPRPGGSSLMRSRPRCARFPSNFFRRAGFGFCPLGMGCGHHEVEADDFSPFWAAFRTPQKIPVPNSSRLSGRARLACLSGNIPPGPRLLASQRKRLADASKTATLRRCSPACSGATAMKGATL